MAQSLTTNHETWRCFSGSPLPDHRRHSTGIMRAYSQTVIVHPSQSRQRTYVTINSWQKQKSSCMQLDKLHHTATGLDQVPACMASVTGCCRFRQTNRKAVQRIAGQISRAIAVKEGLDLSCPKRQRILQTTVISGRSPSHQYLFELAYGTHGCQEIPLSSI